MPPHPSSSSLAVPYLKQTFLSLTNPADLSESFPSRCARMVLLGRTSLKGECAARVPGKERKGLMYAATYLLQQLFLSFTARCSRRTF